MSHNKSFVFPYGARLEADGNVGFFPVARVLVKKGGEVRASLFLVIDSGATISALPKTDAVLFGIQAEHGTLIEAFGIGGATQGWVHKVRIYLDGMSLSIPLMFIDSDYAPRILGREGVFRKFSVIFEENKKRTALTKSFSKEGASISKTVDSFGC